MEGEAAVEEIVVNGRIEAMAKVQKGDGEVLVVVTDKHQFVMLQLVSRSSPNLSSYHWKVVAKADLSDPYKRMQPAKSLVRVDPRNKFILVHTHHGILHLIPVPTVVNVRKVENIEPLTFRFEQHGLVDAVLVKHERSTTMVALCADRNGKKKLAHYDFDRKALELKSLASRNFAEDVFQNAHLLIPCSDDAFLVLACDTISYVSLTTTTVHIAPTTFVAYASAPFPASSSSHSTTEMQRYLVSDHHGSLYVLLLTLPSRSSPCSIHLRRLGTTSIPSCLVYLSQGRLFVGSHFGDSLIVELKEEMDDTGTYLEIKERITNVAPVSDIVVASGQDQTVIVTCSGAYKDGSLRVIRNGVGVNVLASIDVPALQSLWTLSIPSPSSSPLETHKGNFSGGDALIVATFLDETMVFCVSESGDIELIEGINDGDGIVRDDVTLTVSEMLPQSKPIQQQQQQLQRQQQFQQPQQLWWVQVTTSRVRVINALSGTNQQRVSELVYSHEKQGFVADVLGADVALGVNRNEVRLFHIDHNGVVTESSKRRFEHEVSCLSFSSCCLRQVNESTQETAEKEEKAKMCCVGFWNHHFVSLLDMELNTVMTVAIPETSIPRSILMTVLETTQVLAVALGDGRIVYYMFSPSDDNNATETINSQLKISEMKETTLGSRPARLYPYSHDGNRYIFIACDKPTLLHVSAAHLRFSRLTLSDASSFSPFPPSSKAYGQNAVLLSTMEGMTICEFEKVQKLHVQTYSLNEQPRRIGYDDKSSLFCVVSVKCDMETGVGDEVNSIKLVDGVSFEVLDSYVLPRNELGQCILSFSCEEKSYWIVGTALVEGDEDEPQSGRLVVLEAVERKLQCVATCDTTGAVYCIARLAEKIVCGINNKVCLFDVTRMESEVALKAVCEYAANVLVLTVSTRSDFILVGDLMKSIAVLRFDEAQKRVEEVCRDFNTNWMTAAEFLDDDHYIGAESGLNIFLARKNADAMEDDERKRMVTYGLFHTGPSGSLISTSDNAAKYLSGPMLLFGTISGAIGLFLTISEPTYRLLEKLQSSLCEIVETHGFMRHDEYRSFVNERKKMKARGVIDGELVQMYLTLEKEQQKIVAEKNGTSVTEITDVLDTLGRVY